METITKSYRIERPAQGATYRLPGYGVYAYSEYPSHSVLRGQNRREFLAVFPTLLDAIRAYPMAEIAD